jgi:hypothetical protein
MLRPRVLMTNPGRVQRIAAALLVMPLAATLAAVSALSAPIGPVPPRLAGIWAATLPNYPAVGLYKGRYKLRFGPGATMHYIVPGEGAVPQGVSVAGNRITFMPSGFCTGRGTYVWRVERKTLTFSKVRDTCRKRVIQLVREWTRVV